jgi:hypothetical protein
MLAMLLALCGPPGGLALAVGLAAISLMPADAAAAGPLPEIRSSLAQPVPACVTPDRLMQYLRERNDRPDPRFRDIARLYKTHGEALGIRWDYAFFQMLLETNYLTFRRGNGERGDVDPRQNNFAGLGATGGGAPGDSYPDVSTGVLAQMQHLLVYSGQRVDYPIGTRTREKQDDILTQSRALRRPVRFSDLTRRWAADRNYHQSIEVIAERYRNAFCVSQPPAVARADRGGRGPALQAGAPCEVYSASYGGNIALLIRSAAGGAIAFTVLQVEEGLAQSQAEAFIALHARNGQTIGRFASAPAAFARAFELCPGPS